MKTLKYLSAALLTAFLLSSCSSLMNMNSYDEVYYNPKMKTAEEVAQPQTAPETTVPQPEDNQQYSKESQPVDTYSETEVYEDKNGDTYITNNYYGDVDIYDDYDYYDYDYKYSRRLKRFYHPYTTYSYFHPYFYDIYWYNPYYYNGFSFYFGWGYSYYGYSYFYDPFYYDYWRYPYYYNYYPYYYYGYDPWYYPYGYGSYYSGYWNGYHHGYWNGYWNGYYDDYYNDNPIHGGGNFYYGPRQATGTRVSNDDIDAGDFFGSRKNADIPYSSSNNNKTGSYTDKGTTPTDNGRVIEGGKADDIRKRDQFDNPVKTEDRYATPSGVKTPESITPAGDQFKKDTDRNYSSPTGPENRDNKVVKDNPSVPSGTNRPNGNDIQKPKAYEPPVRETPGNKVTTPDNGNPKTTITQPPQQPAIQDNRDKTPTPDSRIPENNNNNYQPYRPAQTPGNNPGRTQEQNNPQYTKPYTPNRQDNQPTTPKTHETPQYQPERNTPSPRYDNTKPNYEAPKSEPSVRPSTPAPQRQENNSYRTSPSPNRSETHSSPSYSAPSRSNSSGSSGSSSGSSSGRSSGSGSSTPSRTR
ncbi:MAG: hypothetical protein GX437_10320 [Sphingobacteriales bacterium]|nr:hypothetical protein [Sphingobacteriales bacterium]